MRDTFECPACAADDWEQLSDDVFTRNQGVKRPDKAMSEYLALRRRVLFEVWFPGAAKVCLTSVMCRNCGFMTYRPRPSAADIDAKYRLLQREEQHIGSHGDGPRIVARHLKRARRVFNTVSRQSSGRRLDVLDFGGGDGKMLLPFQEAGHRCFLVDYNVEPCDGIEKLGDTLDDLPGKARFDVIVCSHVIEHLAEPQVHVERFHRHLRDGGLVYGEVPLGIWRGIGIGDDPVTHINFFTTYSFGRLFERFGFRVATLRRMVGQYTRRLDVIIAISVKENGVPVQLANDGVAEARAFLAPSLTMDVARHVRLGRYPTVRGLARRVKRRLH